MICLKTTPISARKQPHVGCSWKSLRLATVHKVEKPSNDLKTKKKFRLTASSSIYIGSGLISKAQWAISVGQR
jgi:hypothetical protein